ncbi:sigma 54-interacting transcriptional regulator [Hymenobacter lapidiphilus]|uniref:Sigma 54-interacting transcriptional regulator n=1 Tax=Hymenobacter lapidiphilus TaxID=2608003 RepID=A0A7Y7PQM3_9BACT|nr:sigma 54-interacting transcriptional regulator [Hymenobacter lapidiphilus]NVO32271.1 sigma 54-interacting transcriptional regulator [Hymenobacter lapidiphilus]
MKARELVQVLEVSTALATVRDQAALLALVVEKIKPLFDFEDCGIFVVSADGQHHRDLAAVMPEVSASGWNDFLRAHNAPQLAHPGSPVAFMLAELQAHGSPRVFDFQALRAQFPDYPQFDYEGISAYHDCLAAPLQSRGRVFGMFCLNALRKDHFQPAQFPLFQALAEQVAGAVANILANEEMLAREWEKTTLLGISAAIASATSAEALLTTVREKAKLLFDFHDTGILIVEPDGQFHYDLAVTKPTWDSSAGNRRLQELNLLRIPHPGSYIDVVMQEMEASGSPQIEDYRARIQQFDYPFFAIMAAHGYHEGLGTLLRVGGKTLGTFWLNALQKNHFEPASFGLFQALADQVAVAVANILANEDILAREREKSLLLSISKEITKIHSRKDLLDVVFNTVRPILPFDDVGLFYFCDPDGTPNPAGTCHIHLTDDVGSDLNKLLSTAGLYVVPEGTEGVRAAATDAPGLVDFRALQQAYPGHPFYPAMNEAGIRQLLAMGIKRGPEVIGMLSFNSCQPNFYTEQHFPLFEDITNQIAVVVANLLANEEILEREREKSMLLAVSETIATVRERKELITTIINQVKPVIPIDDTGIAILSRTGEDWQDWTNVDNYQGTNTIAQLQQLGYDQWQPVDALMEYTLHHSGIMSMAQFKEQYPEHPFGPVMWDAGLRELMFTSLVNGGRKLGVLFFDTEREGTYTPAHLTLFKALADLIATAVANILANEDILARKQEKALLLSISQQLAGIRSRTELREELLANLKTVFGYDEVVLSLYSPDLATVEHLRGSATGQPMTVPDKLVLTAGLPVAGGPHEVFQTYPTPRIVPLAVMAAQYPGHPGIRVMQRLRLQESVIMPLRNGPQLLGQLEFHARQAGHFAPAQLPVFSALADQIAVVVANILANEEIIERERENSVLLSISEAISRISSRGELLRVIYEIIRPVLPFDNAGLFVFDDEKDELYEILNRHTSPDALQQQLDHALELGPWPLSASSPRSWWMQEHTVIRTFTEEAAIARHHTGDAQLTAGVAFGLRHLIGGPLFSRGRRLGALCFNSGQEQPYAEKHFSLFKSISEQLSVAVANILAIEEIVAREREKSLLLSLSEDMATVRDRDDLFRVILTKIKPLVGFEDAVVSVYSPDFTAYKHFVTASPPERLAHPLYPDIVGQYLPVAGNPDEYVLAQLRQHGLLRWDTEAMLTAYPTHFIGGFLRDNGLLHNVYLKLSWAGELIGFLNFHFTHSAVIQAAHYGLYRTIADQLAVAVANLLATEDIARRVHEKELELAVNNALVSSKDRESLCRALAGQMSQLVPFSFFVLCTWNPAEATNYQLTLRRQPDGEFTSVRREVLQLAPPELTQTERDELFAHPGVYAGPDYETLCARYPLYHFVREHFGLHAQLRLSLRSRTGVHTSIVVSGTGAHDFQPADYDKLHHLVPQITLALDNLLAFENLDQQRREKAAQVAVTNVLTSALTFNELVPALARQLEALVRCDLVHLCLLPPRAVPDADVAVVRENGQFRPLTRAEVQPLLSAEALTSSCMQLQELAAVPRLYVGDELPAAIDAVPLLRYFYEQQAVRALLLLPLRVGGELVGGLLLGHRFAYAFTDRDRACLEAVAAQMALALGHRFAFAEIASLQQQLTQENSYLQDEIKTTHNFEEIIGTSPPMLAVFRQVSQVAGTDTTVCIGGETGTGKELVARALHNLSPRHDRLLVKVNCAALPAQLIESELFGHEKGAFTGAHDRRLGKFELADGGSIFLDEIGEMPLELQAKLLRVLQEKEIERLGGKGPIRTDVRIIAATNRDLAQEVQAGRFRQDLYFRLMVFPLVLPPLRERKEDLPALANHFLFQFARKMGKPHKGLAPAALRELMAHDWPGNIRELQHVLEQAVIVSTKPLLQLARSLRPATPAPPAAPEEAEAFRRQSLAELEGRHIVATLRYTNGRIRGAGGAAELLAIKATTLEARMKKLGIGKSHAVLLDVHAGGMEAV